MIIRPDILPRVSAILPCGYGLKYVPLAIDCFMKQNYPGQMELVIVDNNDEGATIHNLLPQARELNLDTHDPRNITVRYMLCDRTTVGALRNIGSEWSTGDVLMSWDEDDWYSPDRITQQVERLRITGKEVTGWHSVLFWDSESSKGYKYHYSPGRNHPPYACGTSQCYTRLWWDKHPFPEQGVEDWPFTQAALNEKQLDSCDAEQLCIVRAHRDSKCPPTLGHRQFPEVDRTAFPQSFFDAIGFENAVSRNSANGAQEQ